jgi:excisionase family DNA binding protein
METTQIPRLLVSKREAASALGVSVRTVDNLLASKELRARKIGRRTLPGASWAKIVEALGVGEGTVRRAALHPAKNPSAPSSVSAWQV